MTRRRRAARGRKLNRMVIVLLLIADLALGITLWQDHGVGPVIVGLITAALFAAFLRSRPRRRRH